MNKWNLRTKEGRGKYLSYLKSCLDDEERKSGLKILIDLYTKKGNYEMAGYCFEILQNFDMACKYYAMSAVQKIAKGKLEEKKLDEILQTIDVALNHPKEINKGCVRYIANFFSKNEEVDGNIPYLYKKMKRKCRSKLK